MGPVFRKMGQRAQRPGPHNGANRTDRAAEKELNRIEKRRAQNQSSMHKPAMVDEGLARKRGVFAGESADVRSGLFRGRVDLF